MDGARIYLLGMVFLVIEALSAVVEPYPIAYLVDFLQQARPSLDLPTSVLGLSPRYQTILLLTLAIVLIAAVNSAADSLTEVCMARGGRSLGYRIRVAMYAHLQRLPLGFHDRKQTGDVLTRVTGDVLVVEDFVVKSASNILGSLLVLVGSFVFLLTQSWGVALVALAVVPLLALVSNHYSRRIKVASKTQRDREGDLASTAQEMLTSIRLVQSYGRGHLDLARFSGQTSSSMDASVRAANIQAQFSFVVALVEALSIATVVWVGVWLVDRSAITIGTLVLLVLLLQNMFKPARKIVSEWYKVGKVFASVERIQDLFDRDITVRDLPEAVPARRLAGGLAFRHVSFTYPTEHPANRRATSWAPTGPRVLDDVDFDVAPGEVVALVGASGAGKSTIAQLVPRLYDPDLGEVLVDGTPVRRFTLASLRSQVSLVLQDTVLLRGTVAENISYGIADATQADIEDAARAANAHSFIIKLPQGYDTNLGERGATLSGGQRQRLAIARAFIRKAPILILDEPTTGLDAESAEVVVSALRSLMRGTTTIVVSHDPALVRCADRVLVVRGGKIVAAGSPDQAAIISAAPSSEPGVDGSAAGDGQAARVPALPDDRLLVEQLGHTLPGLGQALDPEVVAEHITRRLLPSYVQLDRLEVGKIWVHQDGSCALRYAVRITDAQGREHRQVLLGRLHRDEAAMSAYLTQVMATLADVPGAYLSRWPWRTATAQVRELALALHPFPVDPALPTLGPAMQPEAARRAGAVLGENVEVGVVHHPRTGACVLRYAPRSDALPGSGPEPGEATTATSAALYGKVYPDGTGAVVDDFLRALGGHRELDELARFPTPIGYDPTLRLLLTQALPGHPSVPRLLRESVAGEPTKRAALRAAVRASGRALAGLHGTDLSTAPVRPATTELLELRREIAVVARVWPGLATAIGRQVDLLQALVPGPAVSDLVLSHGDFTPSQILLDGGVPALVDLDTLCWADPALDLGRYLAQLRLLGAKPAGAEAEPLLAELTDTFLAGYGEVSARSAAAATASERIRFYAATSLIRSALHGARQLKGYRLELAMSLLARRDAGRVTP